MAQVLVTGGAGFIGSHIVEELLQRGDLVRVLDNFSTGKHENLEKLQNKIDIREGDLRDPLAVTDAVQGVDFIFHQAAFVSVPQSMQSPDTCFEVNVTGTVTLLEAAHQARVKKVVLASSTAVYGDPTEFPITEETGLKPMSPYAVSKQVNELYARLYTRTFGLPVVALRYFNVYGPRQNPDSEYAAVIPIFIHLLFSGQPVTIFGDGKQTRDFIFVKDIVRANLLAAETQTTAGEAINVCSGHETSLLELLDRLNEITPHGSEVHFKAQRPGDIYRSVGSSWKADQLMGFCAQTSLTEGLKQTVNWMKEK